MKVLWLLNFLPPAMCRELGINVQASGSWVTALLGALQRPDITNPASITLCGYSCDIHQKHCRKIKGISYIGLPANAGKNMLKEVLDEVKPDLVQLFGTENDHSLHLFELFDPEKILVYIQGLAAPCGEHMTDGLPEYFLDANPLKEVAALHTGGLTVRQQKEKLANRGIKEENVIRKAHYILGRTDWDREYCLRLNPRAEYFHLGEIMRPSFYPGGWRRERCLPHRIFVSQANAPLKGFHRAIQALPELCRRWPDTQLYVAGWPPPDKGPLLRPLMNWLSEYTGYLAKLAKILGVEGHIHYTGILDEVGMRHQLMAAETFLICSNIENSPNALGEAMLMGLPCVASAVGGIPSMLEPGQGILFDPEEKDALAASIIALWEDPANADRLGRSARMRALEDHDPVEIAHAQIDIYKKLIHS